MGWLVRRTAAALLPAAVLNSHAAWHGLTDWVNRDDCHCHNCPLDIPQECHLYWAITTPEVHCNHK